MRFSPSSLSVFRDCRHCFWLEQRMKVKRPRGIYPSLPGGMDRLMKAYVEAMLASGADIPHLATLKGAAPYHDRAKVQRWQNWRTGLSLVVDCGPHGSATLTGAIDDLIEWSNGMVSPWDFKTKSSPPKDGDSEAYYGPQLDAYHALLEGASLPCTGKGYLTYLWPENCDGRSVAFAHQTVVLDTDPTRAHKLVREAAACLAGAMPECTPVCEYCSYVSDRQNAGVPA